LTEELKDHPGDFVVGNDRGVAGCEDGLDYEGKDDLMADMLDLVDERRQDPSAYNTGHIPRDLSDPDLDGVISVYVKCCLGASVVMACQIMPAMKRITRWTINSRNMVKGRKGKIGFLRIVK
jgi:hypothetical protein